MAAKGYTTNADVASLLGRTFTGAENTLATRLIEAAEDWIDDKLGVAYKENAAKTEHFYDYPGPLIRLAQHPVSSVVVALVSSYGATEEVLDAADYQVRDAEKGLIFVPALAHNIESYYSVRVTYTAGDTVPPRVKLGCELLVSHWMRPALLDESFGISSFSVGNEEQISYSEMVERFGVPAEVWSVLGINPGGNFYFA